MRYVFLAILLLSVMFSLITWVVRPDLLQVQYERITAPIQNHFAAKRAAAWQAAKDQAWNQWLTKVHLPGDCSHPATALHALECKNEVQLQASSFEQDWAKKIANGWRPEGLE